MPNYSKTHIYKLCCKNTDITDIYIGHTTNFTRRKQEHKIRTNTPTNKEYNVRVYSFIRENGGFENWDMIQIEEFNANNVIEARTRERYWVEQMKPSLNCDIPNRSGKEYREDNKDVLREKKKEYREQNKDVIREKKKEYHKENKEVISEKHKKWYEANRDKVLERVKEYREQNKEVISEKNKIWREKNKEEISAKRSEKVQCSHCTSMISKRNMPRHIHTIHNL